MIELTWTGSGISVILTWLNRTRDSRHASIRLLFADIHLQLNNVRYSPDCSSDVNYLFVADVKCGFYEFRNTQKQQRKCSTWTETGPQNVPRPSWNDVRPYWSRSWTCSNSSINGMCGRWSLQLTALTSWIRHCCVPVGSTARSSFRLQTRKLVLASCRFTHARWTFSK